MSSVGERDWSRAVSLLVGAPQVALACHVEPDGDALGSMLALAHHLRATGTEVVAAFGVAPGASPEVPAQYAFLPGVGDLVSADDFPPAPAVLVVLDCAAPARLGALERALHQAGAVLVVDHHASGTPFGDVRVVDPDAAATAVLVEELIRRAGGTMDRTIATCLYTGLVTDTGRFAFSSVTPEVMELGARLLDRHIDHAAINRQVWETHSLGYLKLLGRVCERAAFVPAVGLAWSVVYERDVTDLDVATGELDSVVDVVRSVACARSTLLVRQLPGAPGAAGALRWKLSLRSRGGVDVGRAAAALGGGGHAFAAGCTVTGPLDEVVDRVVALLASGADPALVG